MILRREPEESGIDVMLQDLIPATFDNDILKFKNNGISEVFFGVLPTEIVSYNPAAFQFFGVNIVPLERPFFVAHNGKEPLGREITDEEIVSDLLNDITTWELYYVYSRHRLEPDGTVRNKRLQYTCLRRCKPGTMFCRCDDCGEHFVITPQAARFYTERELQLPTVRCKRCIQKKRIRYAAINNRRKNNPNSLDLSELL